MKFKHICPNCKAKDKIVIKCKKCWKYTCSECTTQELCKDCYIIMNDIKEVNRYFIDKEKESTVL